MSVKRGVVASTVAAVLLAGGVGAAIATGPVNPPQAAITPAKPAGITVVRIIDGDTFVTNTGETIRVLGIDSCEKNTKGGPRATADAHRLLDGKTIVLKGEPRHDTDRYGRSLRYVALPSGADYGAEMVKGTHTYVYPKRNDASKEYVANLRRIDVDGRNCDR